MNTIGFVISHKSGEQRRAILPGDLQHIRHTDALYFEAGYGRPLGFRDEDYLACGGNIVTREEALRCSVICDVKLGDADFLPQLTPGKILFGWAHAVQNQAFTKAAVEGRHTVLAWEEIYVGGRYLFYRNREIAGEAAIMQAFLYTGKMPYDATVAIYGSGQTAKGALRILHGLGAQVDVYKWRQIGLFRENMANYDVLVNCCMWDTARKDRLIYHKDLQKLRPGTMIIDVSCDPELEIETSRPTTIRDPVYTVDGILHYAVDNTPAMFPHTVSKDFSHQLRGLVDCLVTGELTPPLREAIVIDHGRIVDERIRAFRDSRSAAGCGNGN